MGMQEFEVRCCCCLQGQLGGGDLCTPAADTSSVLHPGHISPPGRGPGTARSCSAPGAPGQLAGEPQKLFNLQKRLAF